MAILFLEYINLISEDYTPNFGSNKSLILFLPDFILYMGIIWLIIIFGFNYKKLDSKNLLYFLNKINHKIIIFVIVILLLEIFFILKNTNVSSIYCTVLFSNTFTITLYTQFLKLIVLLVTSILYSYIFSILNNIYYINAVELPLLLHINITLATTLISCNQYIILLLVLEGFSLILYILTTIDRSQGGILAAVKYFSFGTLGSILMFWGVVHLYLLFPSLSFSTINFLSSYSNEYYMTDLNNSIKFSSTLIICGLLIKLGAAPVHQWVADVYAGSHIYITAYFSTVVKLVIYIILYKSIRIFNEIEIINIFIIFSLVIGSFMTLRQLEIKRFLAYSSITHVGFLLMGDIISSHLYILVYVYSSLLFFSVLLTFTNNKKELIYFSDLSILKINGYWAPLMLTISLFSMAGLPPFSGFFGKFMIWENLIEDIYLFNDYNTYLLLILSLLLSILVIFYYIRILIYIFVNDDKKTIAKIIITQVNFFSIYQQQLILAILLTFWFLFQSYIISGILLISYL